MAAINDITGDVIQTKVTTSTLYEDNYDRVFGKNAEATVAQPDVAADKPAQYVQLDLFDEDRMDTIGANGNEGLHYPTKGVIE